MPYTYIKKFVPYRRAYGGYGRRVAYSRPYRRTPTYYNSNCKKKCARGYKKVCLCKKTYGKSKPKRKYTAAQRAA